MSNLIFLTCEELIFESEAVIDFLSAHLELPKPDLVRKALGEPSNTSNFSLDKTNSAIRRSDKRYLLEKWKDKVGQS